MTGIEITRAGNGGGGLHTDTAAKALSTLLGGGKKTTRIRFSSAQGSTDESTYRIATKKITSESPTLSNKDKQRYAVLEVTLDGNTCYAVVNRTSLKRRFKLKGDCFTDKGNVSSEALKEIQTKLKAVAVKKTPNEAKSDQVQLTRSDIAEAKQKYGLPDNMIASLLSMVNQCGIEVLQEMAGRINDSPHTPFLNELSKERLRLMGVDVD